MRLNSKLTWGLAWAGLALVIAVPSADLFTSGGANSAAVLTSDTDPVQTASIPPVKEAPRAIELAPAATPVKVVVGAPALLAKPAVEPAVVGEPAPVEEVASLPPPAKAAPFPAPLSQRPQPVAPAEEEAIVIPQEMTPDSEIILPPAGIPDDPDVADPDSLREYLVARGLIEPGPGDSAESIVYLDENGDYDPDGFYLSDGPNAESRPVRRTRLDLLYDEWELLPF